MKYITFTLLLFLFTATLTYSQKGYLEGYAVTNEGDTVKGMVKHKTGDEIKDKITVKKSEEEKVTLKAAEITGFVVGDEEFRTIVLDKDKVFMKRLAAGPVFLYEYQYINENSGSYTPVFEVYITKEAEKSLVMVKPGSFKKTVATYISDYPELAVDVDKGKYKIDDIEQVILKYNSWRNALEE